MFEMIIIVVLGVVAIGAIGTSIIIRNGVAALVGVAAIIVGLVVFFASSFYTNEQGQGKVITNFDGTIAGENFTPGGAWKAPWQGFSEWDLFSQELTYAGGKKAPDYTGGTVNGQEVSSYVTAVGLVEGTDTGAGKDAQGSTATYIDISVVYSLDGDQIKSLYQKYKTQERFTKQIVEKTVLNVVRDIPSKYTTQTFRGSGKQAAQDAMFDAMNAKLNPLGVNVDFVNIQDIRYSQAVEDALSKVEVANQGVVEAQAAAQAAVAKAKGEADAKIETATGEAEANRLLNDSLSDKVLQARYIEALKAGTVFVVPEGSNPLVQTGSPVVK
jgi:regulator of protease activity HflC (stomatin/prohibitin superfamily)